ncbi:MAG: hypothetical protein JNK46_06635 [Methylobacteriaceae bacterium]|nr:hypothetical protein [Methylobacteriaceae bacterium]
MTDGSPCGRQVAPDGRNRGFSPALLAGLALMPLLIAAGLLRERLDAAAPMLPDAALRPTLSAAPAPVVAARAAELSR